jgi:hypothetical protein
LNSRKTAFWRYGIAGRALLAAIAVYCLARIYPPELLAPFQTTNSLLAEQTALFGSAPSLFYSFAIGLFVGSGASSRTGAKTALFKLAGTGTAAGSFTTFNFCDTSGFLVSRYVIHVNLGDYRPWI